MDLMEYLKKENISITEFAEKIDYTREHISKLLSGKNKSSAKLKRKIEKATNGKVKF